MAKYRESEKKDYMKYYKEQKAAGKPVLSFAKWLGPNWKPLKKNSKAAKPKSKKTKIRTRTGGVTKELKNAAITYKELSKLRDKK